jgi:hypothetical protein
MAARLAVFLAACGMLAGCGLHAPAKAVPAVHRVPAASYAICLSLAPMCTSTNVVHEPAQLHLFTARSGFVQDVWVAYITWRSWGAATATGRGLADIDNCKPSCEEGTFSEHLATIVVTDPKPWHGNMVYTHVTGSVPSIGYHEVYDRGLLPEAGPAVRRPAFAVTNNCQMGFELSGSAGGWSGFLPGAPPADYPAGGQAPTVAYKLSIFNVGANTAKVGGLVVAFYDASGSKLGSDHESAGDTFLTAGQSRYWLEVSATSTAGKRVSGTNGHPDDRVPFRGTAATCTLIKWQHP